MGNKPAKPQQQQQPQGGAGAGGAGVQEYGAGETCKPLRQYKNGSRKAKMQDTLQATMKSTLGHQSIEEVRQNVKLPKGEDLSEWIAGNTVNFYNMTNLLYAPCIAFCTEESCPKMRAGAQEYLWKGENQKKPVKTSAPKYIDSLLEWINSRLLDEKLFPTDDDTPYPASFLAEVSDIYKRLFRVFAHLYHHHYEDVKAINALPHLNTCFKHFICFVQEFRLVDAAELAPLKQLIEKF